MTTPHLEHAIRLAHGPDHPQWTHLRQGATYPVLCLVSNTSGDITFDLHSDTTFSAQLHALTLGLRPERDARG